MISVQVRGCAVGSRVPLSASWRDTTGVLWACLAHLTAPCFVLTHSPRPPLPQARGTFTFVSDGIETALEQANTAAGERIILLMGGPSAHPTKA